MYSILLYDLESLFCILFNVLKLQSQNDALQREADMRLFLFLLLEEQIQYVTGGLNPYVTIYTSFEIPSYMLGTTDLLGKKNCQQKKTPRVVSLFHWNMNCSNLYTFYIKGSIYLVHIARVIMLPNMVCSLSSDYN